MLHIAEVQAAPSTHLPLTGWAPRGRSGEGLTFWEDGSHFQVAGGQADDGRLVQLGGDGRGQREQLGQLVEFSIFLFPSRFRGILGLLLHCGYCEATRRVSLA